MVNYTWCHDEPEGSRFRSFSVWTMFFETTEELDEYVQSMQMRGLPFQEEGDFVTAVLEVTTPPTESVQLHIAGDHFYMLLMDIASSGESLFCGKDRLTELLSIARSNIAVLEVTPLPPEIPKRRPGEGASGELHEVIMTVRSDELSPPARVPEEQLYNNLWFDERLLMQVFNFIVDGDWQYVMTVTGAVDTKFEVLARVSPAGDPWSSRSSTEAFSLYSDTLTITRPQPLGEEFEPPVNVEITVFFDLPISWVMTIAK